MIYSIGLDNIIKILVALFIGGIIGWEREKLDKNAGLRTCIFVILSATLYTILSLSLPVIFEELSVYNFNNRADLTRIIQGAVTGIGFLGAGVIMKRGKHIEGVTTASVIFILMAIGILTGAGFIGLAVLSGLVVFIILKLGHLEKRLKERKDRKEWAKYPQ